MQRGPQQKPRVRLLCVADFIENHSHVTFSLKLASLLTSGREPGNLQRFMSSHVCDEDFRNIKIMNPWMFSCVFVWLQGPATS